MYRFPYLGAYFLVFSIVRASLTPLCLLVPLFCDWHTVDPESAIKFLVPNYLAGVLIGKKGATIKDVSDIYHLCKHDVAILLEVVVA